MYRQYIHTMENNALQDSEYDIKSVILGRGGGGGAKVRVCWKQAKSRHFINSYNCDTFSSLAPRQVATSHSKFQVTNFLWTPSRFLTD